MPIYKFLKKVLSYDLTYKVLKVQIMAFKISTSIGLCSTALSLMKCCRDICHLKTIKSYNVNQEKRQRILFKSLVLNKVIKRSICSTMIKDDNVVNDESTELYFVPKKTLLYSLVRVSEGTPDFKTTINNNSTLTDKEWHRIRENTLQNPSVTKINLDSHIMNACLALNNTNAVISYYKYLQNNGHTINLAVTRKYLTIFQNKKESLTSSDKLEITQVYDQLCKKYPQLDEQTARICISNMCLTDRWKEVEYLIKHIAKYNKYVSNIYSDFASAAFVNGEPDIGWKYARLYGDNQLIPNSILRSFLQYCNEYAKDEKGLVNDIERMFQFLAENSTYPSMDAITMYMDVLKELNWSVQSCTISNLGICSHCGTNLETSTLSDAELQVLIDNVVKKLVRGSDLFQNTNPKELETFEKFVQKTKPYDIVIDGLNLFYLHGGQFETVIQHFSQQKKKVLLIMRKHLIKNKKLLKAVQNNMFFFAAEDITKDDSYLLYATLASGKDAYFLSEDLMRSQLHLMKDLQLKTVFKKWLLMRRLQVNKDFKFGVISQPYLYVPYAQKRDSCWHIPYLGKQLQIGENISCDSIKWLCLRPKH